MVRHGVNGLTVQSADANALGRAISDLLNARESLEAMKATSRQIAIEEYSLRLQAQRYFELYSRMLAEIKMIETNNGSRVRRSPFRNVDLSEGLG